MSGATAIVQSVIQQGATYDDGWRRGGFPYPVKMMCGRLLRADNNRPALPEDFVPVDYTGATARMQLRQSFNSPDVLLEFSTSPTPEQGRIILFDGWTRLHLSAAQTAALPYGRGPGQWLGAIGQVEVSYGGIVRREYQISFSISPEVTR